MPDRNFVDELNQQYQREAPKPSDEPEPNLVDKINRKAQGGEDTATAQAEAAIPAPPDTDGKK